MDAFSLRIHFGPAAAAILALALPSVGAAQTQTGHWTVQANTGYPIVDAWGAPHSVLVTACVNNGGGAYVSLVQVSANNSAKAQIPIVAGVCRSAVIAMAAGDAIRITAPNGTVSGTYEVAPAP
jgi:hypothetical protein